MQTQSRPVHSSLDLWYGRDNGSLLQESDATSKAAKHTDDRGHVLMNMLRASTISRTSLVGVALGIFCRFSTFTSDAAETRDCCNESQLSLITCPESGSWLTERVPCPQLSVLLFVMLWSTSCRRPGSFRDPSRIRGASGSIHSTGFRIRVTFRRCTKSNADI